MGWFKVLHVSSDHGQLERELLSIFQELNIEFFSTGIYKDPKNPNLEHAQRSPLDFEVDRVALEEFDRLNPNRKLNTKVILSKQLVDRFDLVFIDHCCPYPLTVKDNWEVIKHKPVIWRTYTQQNSSVELLMQSYRREGLKIVRLSPKDRTIPNYAGDDAIIRCPMDPSIYNNWSGSANNVVTFLNFFSRRRQVSNTDIYLKIREKFPNKFNLYGGYNEDCPLCEGYLTWEEQKKKYREAGVYFALGAKPASLTYNFMEALVTGCPVVTWGKKLGSYFYIADWKDTYEVPDLFINGVHCFYSDSEKELEDYIRMLLTDQQLAQKISENGRELAIKLWDKTTIINQWKNFFNKIL